jgi:hypothetical protein
MLKSLIALCLASSLCLGATCGRPAAVALRLKPQPLSNECPTHLDYVVFASLGDSVHWLGLSPYGPQAPPRPGPPAACG